MSAATDRSDQVCTGRHGELIGPCEACEPVAFTAWLREEAPRLAAARAAGDPLYSIDDSTQLADTVAGMPQYRRLLEALSPAARTHFEEQWRLVLDVEWWPQAPELALRIREDWQGLVSLLERDTIRDYVAVLVGAVTAPWGYELDRPSTGREQLLTEAEKLRDLGRRARELEAMIRAQAGPPPAIAAGTGG